jgi:hypothetical protein
LPLLTDLLAIICRPGNALLQNLDRQNVALPQAAGPTFPLVVSPVASGAISLPTLRIGRRPASSSVRPCSPAPHRLAMVVSKLSKVLNQEDALSAPWLRGDLCSPQAPPRAAVVLRKGVIPRFRRHILVCYTQVIMPAGADTFAVVGGGCTGRVDRCKARQDRHARRR